MVRVPMPVVHAITSAVALELFYRQSWAVCGLPPRLASTQLEAPTGRNEDPMLG